MSAELSIVIPNYNTRDLLAGCLRSIFSTAGGIKMEVIVVDNASTDGSVELVRAQFPQVRMVHNSANVGFARAVNQGLRLAQGNYLLLLNSDTELRPGALSHCLEFLKKRPKAGAVGCRLVNPDGSRQPSCESFMTFAGILWEALLLDKLFPQSRLFGRMHLTYFTYDRLEQVDYVKGAFLMTRRATLEDVALLDERFFFYGEEQDWCYRAKQRGWEVWFTPEATVVHHGGGSGDPVAPRIFVQLHKSRYLFYQKHHHPLSSALARIVLAAGSLLRVAGWWLFGILRPEIRNLCRRKAEAFWAAFMWYIGRER
ncbi:MAG: glycosyltransferase family 2 protein [bacterium]|nr:glycosyltransferase family 2 protein [candidate division KSB1 bacterium]MDH7559466.1 glycosyltransferase family 2 protein [bacterium]